MAIELFDAINTDGLFDIVGKAFGALDVLNTSRLTTVPAKITNVLTFFNKLAAVDLVRERTIDHLPDSVGGFQAGGGGLASALQQFTSEYLTAVADQDKPLNPKDLVNALKELIFQMEGANPAAPTNDVKANVVSAVVTPFASNVGDGVMVTSTKRGDGKTQEYILPESITFTVNSTTGQANAALQGSGKPAIGQKLSQDWPGGSGLARSLTAIDARAGTLLSNGGFESEVTQADVPDGWVIKTGTVGTRLKMTDVEVQTITVTGTPTAGTYVIGWVNAAGKQQYTDPLAYNASGSAVQAALRRLAGLESVSVVSTGTTPNFTHTITFNGAGGDLAQVTVNNYTTGGTYTPATVTNGSTHVYSGGKALEYNSNGVELTELWFRLIGLQPLTQYAFAGRFKVSAVPGAGVLTIDLYDGSAVINDYLGVANSFTISAPGLTTSHQSKTGVFRTPKAVPPVVYFRYRISTAVSNTVSVYADHFALVEMTELYPGGPFASIFSGATDWAKGDYYTLACTNDLGGKFQTHFERFFDMSAKGLLLPSDTGGTQTVSDALVA